MKRVIAVLAVLVLIAGGAIFWFLKQRGGGTVGGLPPHPTVSTPFTYNFEFDEKNFDFYVDGDTTGSIFGSSPFYFGKHPLPNKEGAEYEKARQAKVDEIVGLAKDTISHVEAAREKHQSIKKAYLAFLQEVIREEPKSEKDVATLVNRIVSWESKMVIGQEMAKVYLNQTNEDKFTDSMIKYLGVLKALDAGEAFFKSSVDMANASAAMVASLEKSSNSKVADAAKKLDQEMARFDDLKEPLTQIMGEAIAIERGFGQLIAGDHHYAKSAMKFLATEVPKLKDQLKQVKPNEYITFEVITATMAQLSYLDALQKSMTKALNQVDESKLARYETTGPNPFVNSAFAQENSEYAKGYTTLVSPAKKDDSWSFTGALKTGWNGFKSAVHGVQTGAGVIMDGAAAGVRSITRTGYGAYTAVTAPSLPGKTRWESVKNKASAMGAVANDTWQDIKGDFKEVKDNYNNSTSGVQILKDAKAGFDAAEDYIDESVAGAVEKTYGKGNVSWATGKVAKLGAGILTGLGKGIALVGNRQATTGDYVVGALELGGVLLGGSKVIFRGTQIPGAAKGLGQAGWLSAQRVWNAVGTWSMQSFRQDMAAGMKFLRTGIQKALASGKDAEAAALKQRLTALAIESASFNALQAAIRKSNAEIAKAFADLIRGGLRAGQANAGKTMRESIAEVAETIFKKNVKEAGEKAAAEASESLGGKIVDGLKNAFDEFFGEGMDDIVKGQVDELMNSAPKPEEMSGKWTGTGTFTEVVFPEAPPSGTKKGECDMDIATAIKKLKGQTFNSTFTMNLNLSGGGTGTFTILINGKSTPLTCNLSYSEGKLTGSGAKEGAAYRVNGTAVREEKAYLCEGTFTISGTGKAAGVRIVVSYKVKK